MFLVSVCERKNTTENEKCDDILEGTTHNDVLIKQK